MKKGAFYIAFATLVFSTMEIALKFVSGQFDPIQMTFSRFFVGGLVLLPVALKKIKEKGVKIDKSSFLYFTMLGFFGIFLFGTFYQLAISRIQSSVVAVTFSSNPVFVTLLAYLILREPISKNQVAGLIFDIIGILIIINPFNTQLDAMGIIFVLLATFFFSLYAVLGKRETKKYGGLVVTCFGFLIGAVEMMIVSALGNIPAIAELFTSIGLESLQMCLSLQATHLQICQLCFTHTSALQVSASAHTSFRWKRLQLRKLRWYSSSSLPSLLCLPF